MFHSSSVLYPEDIICLLIYVYMLDMLTEDNDPTKPAGVLDNTGNVSSSTESTLQHPREYPDSMEKSDYSTLYGANQYYNSLYNSPSYGSVTKNSPSLQSSYLSSYTTPSPMSQYGSYPGYNSSSSTFSPVGQNISSASQKLDYSAYSSTCLYGNDRMPLQYSGYYPMPGWIEQAHQRSPASAEDVKAEAETVLDPLILLKAARIGYSSGTLMKP
ncbi:Protein of unknown function [Cotesia congregata]|uniref:Uncharacterized protein n=1 Tax=Cotesia congregata TaxID=51543 RepID=A0A8J2HHJ8_COTCN|nr:Protein of unknown function [Cotesia congregata]